MIWVECSLIVSLCRRSPLLDRKFGTKLAAVKLNATYWFTLPTPTGFRGR